MCLLDMAEAGELTGQTFTRTANLVLRFKEYGALVSERWPTRLDLPMPFFYLRTQGFWQGFTLEMASAQSPKSCFVCELNEEFFDLLGNADFRLEARLLLVSRYFEGRDRAALLESLGLCTDGMEKAEKRMCELNEEGEEAARRKGRSARFAVQVVSRYKFTCALTGLCCLTVDGGAIADAAHIESWAESENDDIQEGLALHKNAHWRFGEWLWSVTSVEWGMQIEWKYGGRLLECADGVRLGPNAERSGRHRAFHGSR